MYGFVTGDNIGTLPSGVYGDCGRNGWMRLFNNTEIELYASTVKRVTIRPTDGISLRSTSIPGFFEPSVISWSRDRQRRRCRFAWRPVYLSKHQ